MQKKMTKGVLSFADEYGNNSFDFTKQGTHFIVASIIIDESEKESIEASLELIRKKHFQTGEIKSQNVADNHKRRQLILNEILKLNFSIYAVVVDKQKLFSEGLKYKKSFYKFLNGILYKELFKAYPKLKLSVDEHGENDFLKSFKTYVNKNHIRDLFSGSEFETTNSKQSIIIQLADFIAGTLGRCYDLQKDLSQKHNFLKILKPKLCGINLFPKEYNCYYSEEEIAENEFDFTISQYSTTLAIDFLETKTSHSLSDTDQINCIKLFLLHQYAFGTKKYISSKELINHLNIGRDKPLKDQEFRSNIIGKLRDKGILIASSSKGEGDKKGYKLPSNSSDISKFVDHGNSLILPILNRIKICRDAINLATQNKYDILEKAEFIKLKKMLDN